MPSGSGVSVPVRQAAADRPQSRRRGPAARPTTPCGWRGSNRFCRARPRRRSRSAPRSSSKSRSWMQPMPPRSWPISAFASRGSIASFAPATTCSATSRSSPWARTSAAPGRSRATRAAVLAAGEIHSDISRGFIRAEVVRYEHLLDARLAGRLPRARRAPPRRQGVHRPRRRRDQLPARDLISFVHSDRMAVQTVLVCEAQVPFVHGGAEIHVRELVRELRARGFEAELVSVPVQVVPEDEILPHAAAWRLLDLSARATAGRSTWSSPRSSRPISSGTRTRSRG